MNVIQWVQRKCHEADDPDIEAPWLLPVLLVAVIVYVIGGLAYLWWRMS